MLGDQNLWCKHRHNALMCRSPLVLDQLGVSCEFFEHTTNCGLIARRDQRPGVSQNFRVARDIRGDDGTSGRHPLQN